MEPAYLDPEAFEHLVAEEISKIPRRWLERLDNVAFLTADEAENGEDLLGLYRGIPMTERDASYDLGGAMPDSITLYRLPILREAEETGDDPRLVVRETLWHEIAHHLGFDEDAVGIREEEGSNSFKEDGGQK